MSLDDYCHEPEELAVLLKDFVSYLPSLIADYEVCTDYRKLPDDVGEWTQDNDIKGFIWEDLIYLNPKQTDYEFGVTMVHEFIHAYDFEKDLGLTEDEVELAAQGYCEAIPDVPRMIKEAYFGW